MQEKVPHYFLFDFDSTFIQTEGLEELAALALKENPQKKALIETMEQLTEQGMNGDIPFDVSLRERIKLLKATKGDVENLATILKKKISSSFLRNKQFFQTHKDTIYIISGGFKEFIYPVVSEFGISEDHVFGNTFMYNDKNEITGMDTTNPLSQENGKAKLVKLLNLKGDITIIGDGYTDYKLREAGLAKKFVAFTENIAREHIIQKADYVAATFDDFKTFLETLEKNDNNIILSKK